MRLLYILFILLLFSARVIARDTTNVANKKDLLYVEIGGKAQHYSINYQKTLIKGNSWTLNANIGLGYIPVLHNSTSVPLSVNVSRMISTKSFIQIGGGYTAVFRWSRIAEEGTIWGFDDSQCQLAGSPCITGHDEPFDSYYFLHLDFNRSLQSKYFIGLSLTPFLRYTDNKLSFFPWGGISFGKLL